MRTSRHKIFIIALNHLLLLCILTFGILFFYNKNNNLHHDGRWSSRKIQLDHGVSGAIAFLTSRVALSKNRLNLTAWHGYQEVYLKDISPKSSVQFTFYEKEAYFVFFFSKNKNSQLGIRLSNYDLFPSAFLIVDSTGKFLEKKPIPNLHLKSGINHFEMIITPLGYTFVINNQKLELPTQRDSSYKTPIVGFKGGRYWQNNDTYIDDLIIDNNTNQSFKTSFSNYNYITMLIILLGMVIIIILYKKIIKHFHIKDKWLAIGLSTLVFFSGFTYFYDYYYLSELYPNEFSINYYDYPIKIEPRKITLNKIDRAIKKGHSSKLTKILFIGTSQTWGAGAASQGNTFFDIISQKLGKKNSTKCINASISGSNAAELYSLYKNKWIKLAPQIVVINLSNNDISKELRGTFYNNIEKFITLNNRKHIKTILILEANSIENIMEPEITPNHQILRKLSLRFANIKLLDLHGELLQKYDEGFLWWDYVHLSDYGHQLAADFIFPILKAELKKQN